MATDLVQIYNQALGVVGHRTSLSSPDEKDRGAELCNIWYNSARDQVLSAAQWPTANANKRLALVKERDTTAEWVTGDPDPGFLFSYAAPDDLIRPRFITTFERFKLGVDVDKKLIITDTINAILSYTMRQENFLLWGEELTQAIVHALAAHIAMPLVGRIERAKFAEAKANIFITQARDGASNTNSVQYDSVPSWIQARGTGFDAPLNRFIYPDGRLIDITESQLVS